MDRLGIEEWLKSHKIENYTINEDLSIDIDGGVNIGAKGICVLPVKFSWKSY